MNSLPLVVEICIDFAIMFDCGFGVFHIGTPMCCPVVHWTDHAMLLMRFLLVFSCKRVF